MAIRKFKIRNLPNEKEFAGMNFGRQLDSLRAFEEFKKTAKKTNVSLREQMGKIHSGTSATIIGKALKNAVSEAVKLHDAKEWYCSVNASPEYYDDSFEFWFKA